MDDFINDLFNLIMTQTVLWGFISCKIVDISCFCFVKLVKNSRRNETCRKVSMLFVSVFCFFSTLSSLLFCLKFTLVCYTQDGGHYFSNQPLVKWFTVNGTIPPGILLLIMNKISKLKQIERYKRLL